MNFSKAFDRKTSDFMLNFMHMTLKIYSEPLAVFLKKKKNSLQRANINNYFTSWNEPIPGVPQGSDYRPIIYNLY